VTVDLRREKNLEICRRVSRDRWSRARDIWDTLWNIIQSNLYKRKKESVYGKAKLRCKIAIHRGRSIDTSPDAKKWSFSKLTLMRFQRKEGDTLRSKRIPRSSITSSIYMVHCALIDSVLHVRYLAPAVLISYNTLLQFYNDSFANNS